MSTFVRMLLVIILSLNLLGCGFKFRDFESKYNESKQAYVNLARNFDLKLKNGDDVPFDFRIEKVNKYNDVEYNLVFMNASKDNAINNEFIHFGNSLNILVDDEKFSLIADTGYLVQTYTIDLDDGNFNFEFREFSFKITKDQLVTISQSTNVQFKLLTTMNHYIWSFSENDINRFKIFLEKYGSY